MKGIINYKRYYAVAIQKINMLVVTYQCHKNMKNTIVDCKLLVKWANNSEFWISIKDMKEAKSSGIGFFLPKHTALLTIIPFHDGSHTLCESKTSFYPR